MNRFHRPKRIQEPETEKSIRLFHIDFTAVVEKPNGEEQTNAEDEYLSELIKRDNEISYFRLKYKETTKQLELKDKVLDENKKIISELAKTLKAVGKSKMKLKN